MKAWSWERYGEADLLRLAEVPQPLPGPNEALVRVLGASAHATTGCRANVTTELVLDQMPGFEVRGRFRHESVGR